MVLHDTTMIVTSNPALNPFLIQLRMIFQIHFFKIYIFQFRHIILPSFNLLARRRGYRLFYQFKPKPPNYIFNPYLTSPIHNRQPLLSSTQPILHSSLSKIRRLVRRSFSEDGSFMRRRNHSICVHF